MKQITEFLLKMLPWFLIFLAGYIPVRLIVFAAGRKKTPGLKPDIKREILLLLFHLSVVAVLSQTLTSDGTLAGLKWGSILDPKYRNYKLFKILRVVRDKKGDDKIAYFVVNLLGNIAMFVPFGFLFRAVKRAGIFRATLAGAMLSLFIELYQLLLPRHSDVDDLLLNTLGALIGALLFIPFKRLLTVNKPEKRKKKNKKASASKRTA